jgi:hypothetical protein
VAINIVGVSGKKFSSLGKIVVCPEKIFDSQNGTLIFKLGPPTKGPRHKICLRAPCSSVTLLASFFQKHASYILNCSCKRVNSWNVKNCVFTCHICIHAYVHFYILGITGLQTINYNSYHMH